MDILVVILFLLTALLLIKVSVIIKADNKDIAIYLSALFFRFKLYPTVVKEKKKKKKEDKRPAKQDKIDAKEKKKISFPEIKRLLKVGFKILKKLVPSVISALRIDRFKINLVVASDDAANTAIKYGQLNALVSSIYALVLNCRASKNIEIFLNCDFLKTDISGYVDIKISIRVWRAIAVAFTAVIALLPILNKKENVYD